MRAVEGLVRERIADLQRQSAHQLAVPRHQASGRWERSRDRLGAGLVRLGQRLQANPRPQIGGKTSSTLSWMSDPSGTS